MNHPEQYQLNDITTDYKSAVLAAELIEKGLSPDQLFIWPVGGGIRNYSKDIVSVETYSPETGYQDLLCIKSSREGLYDMLPEGLFHQHTPYASISHATDIIGQIKKHREEEKQARKFFLPFEVELNFLRIVTEMYENRVDKKNTYEDLLNIFRPQWELLEYLDLRQGNLFLHFIPLIASTRGSLSFFENILHLLLQLEVKVYLQPQPLQPGEATACQLGQASLGIDLYTGTGLNEGTEEVVIEFGPLTAQEAAQLLPGTRCNTIVQLLARYCMPADADVRVTLLLQKAAQCMQMDQASANNILGSTTYLPA